MKVDNIRHGVFYHRVQLLREAHAGISVCASRSFCKRMKKREDAELVFTACKTLTINLLTKAIFLNSSASQKELGRRQVFYQQSRCQAGWALIASPTKPDHSHVINPPKRLLKCLPYGQNLRQWRKIRGNHLVATRQCRKFAKIACCCRCQMAQTEAKPLFPEAPWANPNNYVPMKVIDLGSQSSAINNYMAQLRDVNIQQHRGLFRNNLKRIGHAMAYEVSRTLHYSPKTITTPLGVKGVPTIDDNVVIGTVLRAGLALHEGFLDVFDGANSAFVAAYREEGKSKEPGKGNEVTIRLEYMASPHLDGTTFILVDPMLATGGSFELAYKAFTEAGLPKTLHICAVIASEQGIEHLKKVFPSDDVTLWVAAIDPILNDDAYIVPGLGDAGDLSYGPKISNKD